MDRSESVTFGGIGLDRAAFSRDDPAHLQELRTRSDIRLIAFWQGKPLFRSGPEGTLELALLTSDQALPPRSEIELFLGRPNGAPCFAVDLSDWTPPREAGSEPGFRDTTEHHHPDLPRNTFFLDLRVAMTRLTPGDAELAATGRGLFEWHRSHGFCPNCGTPTVADHGGWRRRCPQCGRQHFPRTDPVAIMLVTQGNSVLLGRGPGWPTGMYSLLAGFVEPGETVEAAVRRETWEETGIRVGAVDYLASQPWPFPASLMIGYRAEATSTDIDIDPAEIEDAIWVSREELMAAFAGTHPTLQPARPGAIAHFLLFNWLADRLD